MPAIGAMPDAGAGEHDRAPGVVEHDVAVGQRHREDVADVDGVVQQRGHLAVGLGRRRGPA